MLLPSLVFPGWSKNPISIMLAYLQTFDFAGKDCQLIRNIHNIWPKDRLHIYRLNSLRCHFKISLGHFHGQTIADIMSPEPSFQLWKWLHAYHALTAQCCNTTQLIVENLAQTTYRFSPVNYWAPRHFSLKRFRRIEIWICLERSYVTLCACCLLIDKFPLIIQGLWKKIFETNKQMNYKQNSKNC